MSALRRIVCAWLLIASLGPSIARPGEPPAAAREVPGDSLYQLDIEFTDQDGAPSRLSDRRGRPLFVAMFYGTCTFACPALIDTVKLLERALVRADKAPLDVLLVTFDPDRDDTAALKRLAVERHLDPAYWTLARPSTRDARRLAALLGIQYRRQPSGDFNHTTEIVLLDDQGRIAARTATLGSVDDALLAHAGRRARTVPSR